MGTGPDDASDVSRARRYFLKATAYAAPAIIATIQLRRAHAQGATCNPDTCPPTTPVCMPDGAGCPPDTSGCMPFN
jgi:hypothetical protein